MKIVFILEYYYPHVGGVEKLFKELAEALVKKDHKVLVITNSYDKTLKKEETINGVKIKRLRYYNRFYFTFFSIFQIIKLARGFDLIHTTSYNAAFPAWLAAKILKKKVIITFHEVWGKLWFRLPFMNLFQKTIFWVYEQLILKFSFNKYIAVSGATKEALIKHGIKENCIRRIYNGIEYKHSKDGDIILPENFTFTYLGRIGVSKGLELLIPAAKAFIDNNPKSIFKLITPTTPVSLYKRIDKLMKRYKLVEGLKLKQNLSKDEINKELLSSHCVVIPSHSEGFCFVAAEAASLDVPVISSGRAALAEVVSGKVITMDQMDKESIVHALAKAKEDKYDFIPLREFSFEDCVDGYLDLYAGI